MLHKKTLYTSRPPFPSKPMDSILYFLKVHTNYASAPLQSFGVLKDCTQWCCYTSALRQCNICSSICTDSGGSSGCVIGSMVDSECIFITIEAYLTTLFNIFFWFHIFLLNQITTREGGDLSCITLYCCNKRIPDFQRFNKLMSF